MGGLLRRLLFAVFIMGASTYAVSPFWTAWTIREAVKSGDVETLERKVDWPSVRQSLQASIAEHAQLLPAAMDVARSVRPTLWQRIKLMFGASMLDRFMDRYITAEGLPKLYNLKHGYRTRVRGMQDERLLPFKTRVTKLMRRLKRAEFMSPGRVEIELEDKDNPDRVFVGTIALVGLEWKLTHLIVKSTADAGTSVKAEKARFLSGAASADEDEEARQYADDLKHGRLRHLRAGTGT